MRRMTIAAVLAAPVLLAGAGTATANPGPCSFGFGCGGICLRMFPHIHQHGPLYNYGPYYGYPPFEPYGPWNPYLQYTGPVGPQCNGGGCGHDKHKFGNPRPLFGHKFGHASGCNSCGGCNTCGGHTGILHGVTGGGLGGWHHHGKHHGCSSCCGAAAQEVTGGDVFDRYTGFGHPSSGTAYYIGTPALTDPTAVLPVSFYAP